MPKMCAASPSPFIKSFSWSFYVSFPISALSQPAMSMSLSKGSSISWTHRIIPEHTCVIRSWTDYIWVAECGYQIFGTTFLALGSSRKGFSSVWVWAEFPPPLLGSLPVKTFRCLRSGHYVGKPSLHPFVQPLDLRSQQLLRVIFNMREKTSS